jgi:hypothetical protein
MKIGNKKREGEGMKGDGKEEAGKRDKYLKERRRKIEKGKRRKTTGKEGKRGKVK